MEKSDIKIKGYVKIEHIELGDLCVSL